jgi:hypothetical protein
VRRAVLKSYDYLMSVARVDHGGTFTGLISTLLGKSKDPRTPIEQRLTDDEIKVMMGGLL